MRHAGFIIFVGVCVVFSGITVMAQEAINNDIGIVFNGDRVQANIVEVPLGKILQTFKDAKGINYKGDASVLSMKLSGKIKNATVEEALHRILFHFDHGIVYDKNKRIIQIQVVEKGKGKNILSDENIEFFKGDSTPMAGETKTETFQVIRNCPPPHGPITYAPGEKESFIPKMNVPPPGGLPEHPAITNDDIKRNVPPPGGLPPEKPE